ncbi:MAG: CDP-diacylglycerol--serine O-phosphatidyltransferase [Rhodothermales bacterium]|nr:CDP-diacylglycerol--serine O-phosphatidyltransferase [Rhodothermales bacterium]
MKRPPDPNGAGSRPAEAEPARGKRPARRLRKPRRRHTRRRLRRPRIPRVAVPSFFTLMNLLSGFFALINTAEGNYEFAAWLIIAAGLFDALDGMMARIANATSLFGVELDSLSDVVSFGVAPSFLVYSLGLHELGLLGVVVAALPAICGAIRLARFNVQFEGEKKEYFSGLPIPVQAAVVVAFILVFEDDSWFSGLERGRLSVLIPMVVTLSVLMVSTVPFDALPTPTPRYLKAHPRKAMALLGALLLVLFLQEIGLFIALVVYLAYGIGRALVWLFRDDEDAADPTEEVAAESA